MILFGSFHFHYQNTVPDKYFTVAGLISVKKVENAELRAFISAAYFF